MQFFRTMLLHDKAAVCNCACCTLQLCKIWSSWLVSSSCETKLQCATCTLQLLLPSICILQLLSHDEVEWQNCRCAIRLTFVNMTPALFCFEWLRRHIGMIVSGIIHTVSRKNQYTWHFIKTSANIHQFTKFFHCQIPVEIWYTGIIKILHLTLNMFLHYLVNLENYNCCRF